MTYWLLLFLVAIAGATLAAAGTAWSTAARREREAELVFRGEAIRAAILSYARQTPDGTPRFPARLEDLLEDRRGLVTRRHLRRLYTDPFTGAADWVAIVEGGRVHGVHSRADSPAMRVRAGQPGGPARFVSDWNFVVTTEEAKPVAPPPEPASTPP